MSLSRRSFVGIACAALAVRAGASEPPRDVTFAQDFDEFWETLAERYCYFGEKATDWARVRQMYRPQAIAAPSTEAFSTVIARAIGELYDPHSHVSDPPAGTPRYPSFDILLDSNGLVVSVLPSSAAANAGIRAGDMIVASEGVSLATAQQSLMPTCLRHVDPAASRYALNAAVSGRRGAARRLTVARLGEVSLPLSNTPDEPAIVSRRLGGSVALIRIASFGDSATVAAFDAALEEWGTDIKGAQIYAKAKFDEEIPNGKLVHWMGLVILPHPFVVAESFVASLDTPNEQRPTSTLLCR